MGSFSFPSVRFFLRVCAIGILPVLFVQLFPWQITALQILQSFLVQTLLGAIVLLLAASLLKDKLSTISFATVALIILVKAFPYYFPFGSGYSGEPNLTVGHYNLWHHNENPTEAIQFISQQNADIIGIQELNSSWTHGLEQISISHPYSVQVPHDTCCYGIGLFSRYPITYQNKIDIDNTPAIEVEITVNEHKVKLLYMHTRPPAFPDRSKSRNKQLDQMGNLAKRSSSSWVLFGDFNIVPWAFHYQNLLENTLGKDARRGFHASFPNDYLSLVPIDHLIHSPDLYCTGFHSFPIEGSDHKGIYVGLQFSRP